MKVANSKTGWTRTNRRFQPSDLLPPRLLQIVHSVFHTAPKRNWWVKEVKMGFIKFCFFSGEKPCYIHSSLFKITVLVHVTRKHGVFVFESRELVNKYTFQCSYPSFFKILFGYHYHPISSIDTPCAKWTERTSPGIKSPSTFCTIGDYWPFFSFRPNLLNIHGWISSSQEVRLWWGDSLLGSGQPEGSTKDP